VGGVGDEGKSVSDHHSILPGSFIKKKLGGEKRRGDQQIKKKPIVEGGKREWAKDFSLVNRAGVESQEKLDGTGESGN